MQDIFPELNVTGWTVVHSPDGNLHEPVIDRHRRSRPAAARTLCRWSMPPAWPAASSSSSSSGPAPNTVNVPVLARLLRGMH